MLEKTIKTILISIILIIAFSCTKEENGEYIDDMLYLRHKNADMPVLVKGKRASENIILIIHGGPGANSLVYSYDFENSFEHEFIVAYWDQRASGTSQGNPGKNTFTYKQFAEDINVVSKLLKQKYDKSNIFLLGHSFGVEILLQTLINKQQAKEYSGYIAVNGTHSGYSYYYWQREWVLEQTKTERLFSDAHREAYEWVIANPVTEDNWHDYDGYSLYEHMENIGGYNNYTTDSIDQVDYFELTYSHYSPWSEFVNTYFCAGKYLFDAFSHFDLSSQLGMVKTPGILIFGLHDGNVPVEIGYELDSLLVNSPHTFEVFDKSAHSPMIDEPVKFFNTVSSFIYSTSK